MPRVITKEMRDSLSEHVLPNLAAAYRESGSTASYRDILRQLDIKSDSRGRAGFHSLRVVFASRARAAGIPAEILGGVLGHTTTKQTEHYNRAAANLDLTPVESPTKPVAIL